MVDARSVEVRLQHLSELLGEMDSIRELGRERYESDFTVQLATQHAIQQAVQTCIDIGSHLITDLGLAVPNDYHGVFKELEAAGLNSDLASQLAAAAGMRNILVHGYLDVDDDTVWNALADVDDLRQFADFVEAILEGRGE